MTPTVHIELAGPPKGKGRPRIGRTPTGKGIAFTPKETRNYEAALRLMGQAAMRGAAPIEGPISVVMLGVFPVPLSWSKRDQAAAAAGALRPTGKPDMDNCIKMLDALNGVVWRDDAQIVRLIVDKVYGDRPRLEVDVYLPGGSP